MLQYLALVPAAAFAAIAVGLLCTGDRQMDRGARLSGATFFGLLAALIAWPVLT